jgi:O-Antigen ligase
VGDSLRGQTGVTDGRKDGSQPRPAALSDIRGGRFLMIPAENKKPIFLISAYFLFFGLLSMVRVDMSLLATAGMLLMMLFLKVPQLALTAVILILPFSGVETLNQQIAGIPGLRVPLLLPLVALFSYMCSKNKLKLGKVELFFLAGLVVFLSIGLIRSLPHLNEINWSLDPQVGKTKYILNFFVKPIIYLVPFLIIVGYISENKNISFLNKSIIHSIMIFSVCLIAYYILAVPNKGSYLAVKYAIIYKFGMHTNDLVNFYILSYPILLANLLAKKNLFNLFNIVLCLMGVGILYSRTGYFLIVLSTLLLLSMTRNKKWLPVLIVVGVLTFTFFPTDILERSGTGLAGGKINVISAGRVGHIWEPLVKEYLESPVKLTIGDGTNAIRYSNSFKRGLILQVGHAHNMYLSTILESGFVGLIFYCFFFIHYIKMFNRFSNSLSGYYGMIMKGVLVSVVSFLISGISGREVFPGLENSYLWIVLAFGVAIVQTKRNESISVVEHPESGNLVGDSRGRQQQGRAVKIML